MNKTLPEVTDIPPMPKVKDPKPESRKTYRGQIIAEMSKGALKDAVVCLGELYQDAISTKSRELTPNPLPRKEVISIQPGDKIVLSVEYVLSKTAHERIKETLELEFPNTKAMILDAGMTLEVYREQGKA